MSRPEGEPRTLIFVDMLGFAELTRRNPTRTGVGTRREVPGSSMRMLTAPSPRSIRRDSDAVQSNS